MKKKIVSRKTYKNFAAEKKNVSLSTKRSAITSGSVRLVRQQTIIISEKDASECMAGLKSYRVYLDDIFK